MVMFLVALRTHVCWACAQVPIAQFLEGLEGCDFDIFNSSLRQRRALLPLALFKHHMKGTF